MPKIYFEVESGLYCDFINYLVDNYIYLSEITNTDFGFTAKCYAKDYKKIAKSAKKFQCRTNIVKRIGLYFKIRKILARKGLAAGVCIILICTVLLPKLIWRIDVIAPDNKITEDIYSLLYSNDFYVGAVFSQTENQRIIQQIFMDVDNVGYVTMNFYKGILTCKVDPAINKLPYLQNSTNGNITASMDAVIEDIEIYTGFSDVKKGQSVLQGDVLVSSTYIDRNGTLQQVMPRAYIKAYAVKEYSAQIPLNKNILVRTGKYLDNITYRFAGIQINTRKTDENFYEHYDREKSFDSITVLGFRLPLTKETIRFYEKENTEIINDEKTAELTAKRAVEELIKNDTKLIEQDKCEYYLFVTEESVTVKCKIYGHYNIA